MNGDVLDGVVLADLIHHILSFGGLAKDGVLAIEVRGGTVSDKELRAVGIRASIRHRKNAGLVVATVGLAFAFELVTRSAST